MSLDVTLSAVRETEVFSANITHNLNTMAAAVGLYKPLWRPEELNITKAGQLIPLLEHGLAELKADPEKFVTLEPENKWGTYRDFVPWVERYLEACRDNPDASVSVSR